MYFLKFSIRPTITTMATKLERPPVVVFQFPMQISHLQVFEMFCKNMFKYSVLIVVLVSTAIFSISDANIAFASLPATRAGSLQDIQFKTTGADLTFAHNMCFVNQLVE